MKAITTPRAAVLAFAAPLLFAAPALADPGSAGKHVSGKITFHAGNSAVQLNIGHHGYRGHGHRHGGYRYYGHNHNNYGQRPLRRQAIQACRAAIRNEAHYRGFYDVDFDDGRYAEQIGPRGFRVTFNEVEFEGRGRDVERPVTCIVRRGNNVVDIYGIPQPRRHGHGYRGGYYR